MQFNMKKITLGIAFLALAACNSAQTEKGEATDPNIASQELVEIQLVDKTVYGVGMQLTTTKNIDARNIVVSLKLDEKVWYDTSRIDLTAGDTLYSEVVFLDAEVVKNALVSFEAKTYSID